MKGTKKTEYFLAASVALLTLLVYLPALQNDFVTWDDDVYVYDNPFIRSFNLVFFQRAFLGFFASNWHPLTWMSHALDYAVWGLNPFGHHLTSIVLHALNALLVVVLVIKLLDAFLEKAGKNDRPTFLTEQSVLIAAGATGLLFGIHPLHVESVAWVSERKDLLCSLFFLLGILSYMSYVSYRTYKTYLLSLGFFIFALLSKPMAVTFPLVLLILDWHPFGRIRSWRSMRDLIVEKAPFLALSMASAVVTMLAQRAEGAIQSIEFAPIATRLLVAARSLIAYLGKMIWPLDLIPYYPYPKSASPLSWEYLLPIVLVLGIFASVAAVARKQKLWPAAWAYYVVMLVPVLGIVQVGGQAMADRYTYLPSLGPFLVMGLGSAWVWEKTDTPTKRRLPAKRVAVVAVAVFAFIILTSLTVQQIGIWKDSLSLWSYVIEKEPEKFSTAYLNRGAAFERIGQRERAVQDYDKAIELNAFDFQAYFNRGVALENMGQLGKAIEDFDRAIALNQNDSQMLVARGLVYLKVGQVERGVADLKRACYLGDDFGCKAMQYSVK